MSSVVMISFLLLHFHDHPVHQIIETLIVLLLRDSSPLQEQVKGVDLLEEELVAFLLVGEE